MMFFVFLLIILKTTNTGSQQEYYVLLVKLFFRESIVENEVWHLHKISELFSSQGQKWRNACTTCRFGTDFLLLMIISF